MPSFSSISILQNKQKICGFVLMFFICLLLNFNSTILRGLRNTLTVVDLGTGAHNIPLFEFFGVMPAAFLMTGILAWLMSRYSLQTVFSITLAFFLIFFLCFTFLIYPILPFWKQTGELGSTFVFFFTMSFHTICELWKPALVVILFFGLLNQYIPSADAKKIYAPLMLGGSLGSIIAGPAITYCTSEISYKWIAPSQSTWQQGLNLLILLIVFIGFLAGVLYFFLEKQLKDQFSTQTKCSVKKPRFSLKESLITCSQSSELRLLSWIVIADYIAYSLGEVLFLEVLKHRYPDPQHYCNYMGTLAFWSGLITFLSSLFIAPFILQRFRWSIAALITPICFLITEGLFFIFLIGRTMSQSWLGLSETEWLALVIFLGSVQCCVGRGTKYTLFDSSKEIAYILIPNNIRIKGKLIIDGLCARAGRGGSSLISLCLINVSGGVLASSLSAGIITCGITLSWIICAMKLGRRLEKPLENSNDTLSTQIVQTSPLKQASQ